MKLFFAHPSWCVVAGVILAATWESVPGLVDMAQPGFAEVGVKSKLREAFWYRRTFRDVIPRPIPSGGDVERRKSIPGIFDSVELILTGKPLTGVKRKTRYGYSLWECRVFPRVGPNHESKS